MPQAEMKKESADQVHVTGPGQFDALIIHLATQGSRGHLESAQQIVAPGRQKGVVATVVPEVQHDRPHARSFDSGGRQRLVVQRVQILVVVSNADIRVDGPEKSARADAAAVFLANKGNLLAPQPGRIEKHIHVLAEHLRDRVEKVGAAGFE